MNMIGSILALSDLSDSAHAALHRAAELAASHEANLRLLYYDAARISRSTDPVPKLRRKARRLARLYGLPVSVVDRPARGVSDVGAELGQADLLVTHHRRVARMPGPWRREVSETLVSSRPVPVLVVKGSAWKPYAGVLAAVDLRDEAARRVASWACAVGGDADVDALHVVRLLSPAAIRLSGIAAGAQRRRRQAALQQCDFELQRILQPVAPWKAGLLRRALAVGDSVEEEILARQAESGAQLIVVGRSTDTPWADMLLGSVSRRLLAAAPCDVLIVPMASKGAGSLLPQTQSHLGIHPVRRDAANG